MAAGLHLSIQRRNLLDAERKPYPFSLYRERVQNDDILL